MALTKIDRFRVQRAKRAFSARRVMPDRMETLLTGNLRPMAGDLVLARVDMLGKQTKLELTDGRRAHLFPGDEIIVCFGNRYAPDQYEAIVSGDMSPCDLVAAGGIAGLELSRHQRMIAPTKITPIGLIGDAQGRRLNLMPFGVEAPEDFPQIPAVLSLGTSMNAGKTLTATSLVRGLKRIGFSVAALKITGTGSGGDMWIVKDAGADVSLDFSDAGFATTYLAPIEDIERGTFRLLNHAASLGCDIAVIEIADGLQQLETAQLILSEAIKRIAIGTVFAAYDAMGAKNGVDVLRNSGHAVLALSGRLGRSPLGVREAEAATGLRVYSPWELQEGALIPAIREQAAISHTATSFRCPALGKIAGAASPTGGILNGSGLPLALTGQAANGRENNERRSPAGSAGGGQLITFSHAPRPDPDQPRDLLRRVATHIMRSDVARHCAAPFGMRLQGRTNWRNGFRAATWKTAFGPVPIRIPKLRHGRYTPPFLDRSSLDAAAVQVARVVEVLSAVSAHAFELSLRNLVIFLAGEPLGADEMKALGAELRSLLDQHGPGKAAIAMGARDSRLLTLPLGQIEAANWQIYDEVRAADEEQISAGIAFQRPHAIAGE